MTITRLEASATARKVRHVFSWMQVAFAERYVSRPESGGQVTILNLSDPEVMAAAVARLVADMRVTKLLATIMAPGGVVQVDSRGRVTVLDPRLEQVWRNEKEMARAMAPPRRSALEALFREAGVRRGFRGGIIATGRDCSRVAGLLAAYAFDLDQSVLLLCEDQAFAVVACDEADLHLCSPDDSARASCVRVLKRLGLKPYPGGFRVRGDTHT